MTTSLDIHSGRLAGLRSFVTGGGSGIGAGIVGLFRDLGAEVCSADLSGGDIEVDVTSAASVRDGITKAVESLGGLDVVVCNAGIPIVGSIDALEEDTWDRGFDVNVKGVYLTAKYAWSELAKSKGTILATASAVGLVASPGQPAYCASKAAVGMLIRTIALEGAPLGIRANSVCPGFTRTPLVDRFFTAAEDYAAAEADAIRLHPLGRLGTTSDIAQAFAFLASREASWITGASLPVDGGMSAGLWSPQDSDAVPQRL